MGLLAELVIMTVWLVRILQKNAQDVMRIEIESWMEINAYVIVAITQKKEQITLDMIV